MKPIRTTASVAIDFGRAGGVPLSKERIAIYDSGLVPIERYRRDAEFLRRSLAESLRIDLGWGAEWMPWEQQPVVRDDDGSLRFQFDETDELARLIAESGLRPYWSYCYVPAAARSEGGDWRGMAEDDDVWVELVRRYAGGAAERGVTIGYHEVYNEPDLRDERTGQPHFYTGDLEDYLDLYRVTARAIREVDPAARIGGPALAVTSINRRWLEEFLAMVVEERLPLDFLSFHHYGAFSLENTLDIVDDVLAGFDGFEHLELHLNEYNSFQIDYPRGGLQDGHLLASSFAAELPRLLARRSLTRTHWAQFLDSGDGNFSGMIDIDGVAKPIFSVYEFFQQMPIDRVAAVVDGPEGVGVLASREDGRAAALAWNRHFRDVTLSLDLLGPVTGRGVLRVIGPDGETTRSVEAGDRIRIDVPTGGVALLEFGGPPRVPARRIVQRSYLPRTLGLDAGWCDIDETTATFRLHVERAAERIACSAVLAPADLPSGWDTMVTDAAGEPADGRVLVRVDVPLDADHVRVFVELVDAAAGATAKVSPRGSA